MTQLVQIAATWIDPFPSPENPLGIKVSTLQTPWGYDTLILGGELDGVQAVDYTYRDALRTHAFWIDYHVNYLLDEQKTAEEGAG